MRRMRTTPVIIWCERKDADRATGPVLRLAMSEEGTMAAVVLDHELAKQEARRRNRQRHPPPKAVMRCHRGKRPNADERDNRDDEYKQAALRGSL
jgi:hypothetical protein